MAISKEQPMRPALNDCVDFLNNNLDIESVESGINALTTRVEQLENDFRLRCVSNKIEEYQQPAKHTLVEVELPQNVVYERDVIACTVSGGVYNTAAPYDPAAMTTIPQCYTRYINHYYNEDNHSVVFHWYTTSTATSSNTHVYEGIVIYVERSA